MKTLRFCLTISLLFILAAPAFPLAQAYEPGKPLTSQENWPAGIVDVLMSQTWAAAYWCNGFEYFYYMGDAAAFSKFLEQFAKVKDAELIVQISPGVGYGVTVEGKQVPSDWSVTWSNWTSYPQTTATDLHPRRAVTIEVWVGGHVDLSKVVVPLNIRVTNATGKKIRQAKIVAPTAASPRASLSPDMVGAKLGELAMYVRSVCSHAKLLIGEGSGNESIKVYRLHSPCKTKLKGIGSRVLIGALALAVPASTPITGEMSHQFGLIPQAPAGVYLLAYSGALADTETESGQVELISVSVDGEGHPKLRNALTVPAHRNNYSYQSGLPWYAVKVSMGEPANRANVQMTLVDPDGGYPYTYEFQLDLIK